MHNSYFMGRCVCNATKWKCHVNVTINTEQIKLFMISGVRKLDHWCVSLGSCQVQIIYVIRAIGIVAGVLVVVLLVLVLMRRMGWLGGKDPVYKGMEYATKVLLVRIKISICFQHNIFSISISICLRFFNNLY